MSEVEPRVEAREPQDPAVEAAIALEILIATEVYATPIELFATAVSDLDPSTPPEQMTKTLQGILGSVARRSFLMGMKFEKNHQPEEGEK